MGQLAGWTPAGIMPLPYHPNNSENQKPWQLLKSGEMARVRRSGQQYSATFDTRAEAEAWAAQIEGKMKGGRHLEQLAAEQITLGDALDRYQRDVLPLDVIKAYSYLA